MLRRSIVRALGVLFALAIVLVPLVALADDISNNLDASIDAVAEVMPLNVGGANGTTQLYVTPQNGDGKNGCNLTGSTTLTLSVSSSNTLVATVSPSSVTFTSCSDTKTLTVTPVSQGSSTISVSQTSNNTGATFNLAPATFTVNVTPPPNTAPKVSIVGVTVGATYEKGSVPTATCQVTDAEDGNSTPAVTLSAVSGPLAAYGLGEQTASCSYTDQGGLTASASVTYGIVDTHAPALTVPADITAEATSAAGAAVTYQATASDAVDPQPIVSCSPSSGSTFVLGTTTVNCTATDAAGNSGSGSFNVTVRDTTPPSIAGLPADITKEATGPNGASATYSSPTATDLVDGVVQVVCTPASGSTFPLGTTTVACSATDAVGNTGSAHFSVTVTDTTPPVISAMPKDMTVEATSSAGATASWASPTANDVVDGTVTVVCAPASGSTLPLGKTTVDCSATDKSGNKASDSFVVTVQDTTPPTLSVPASVTAEATGPSGAAVTYTATATDTVDPKPTVTCTPASGSTFSLGTTAVSCTARDSSGNTSPSQTFDVKVQDTTPPAITIVGVSDGGQYTLGKVPAASCTAVDTVSGSVPCSVTITGGQPSGVGTYGYAASATDGAGNPGKLTGSYKVIYGSTSFSGYLQPINSDGSSRFKLGSTVPVKFQLLDANGSPITNAVVKLNVKQADGNPDPGVDEAISTAAATTGNLFRYDSTSQQYIFNLSTKSGYTTLDGKTVSFSAGTWTISALLDDGTYRSINIQLVK